MSENVPMTSNTSLSSAKSGTNDAQLPRQTIGQTPSVADRTLLATKDSSARMHPLVSGFNKLTMLRQFGLLIGLAASIALGFGVVLWSQGSRYQPLLASTNTFDASELIEVLQLSNVDFDIEPSSGMILVKQSDLHKARLAVAGAGLSDDSSVGYELLDQDQPLGQSQFMENARYLRSLEGELSRTIASINQVKTARVHLAIPKRSVFVRDQREPTASVFAELYAGAELDKNSVKAIRNLVATSIPELQAANVSIVDQRGRLLSDNEINAEEELTNRQFEYQKRVEDSLLARVKSILAPIIGSEKFQAEVSADIDFTKIEQAEELFNPELSVVRSEQTVKEERVNETIGGIPGALTNQPPTDAQAPEDQANATQPKSTRDEATRNYEVDRTLSFTQFQQGRIRRLTVAVVIDNLQVTDPETGELTTKEWDPESIDRLKTLVQDTVGFDPDRGDRINIINSPFLVNEETVQPNAFYEELWFWQIAKQILAGLFILILVFAVLRPAIRHLLEKGGANHHQDSQDDALRDLDIDEAIIADDKVSLNVHHDYTLSTQSINYERQLSAIRGLIEEDPGRVALVLKQWVMSND